MIMHANNDKEINKKSITDEMLIDYLYKTSSCTDRVQIEQKIKEDPYLKLAIEGLQMQKDNLGNPTKKDFSLFLEQQKQETKKRLFKKLNILENLPEQDSL